MVTKPIHSLFHSEFKITKTREIKKKKNFGITACYHFNK